MQKDAAWKKKIEEKYRKKELEKQKKLQENWKILRDLTTRVVEPAANWKVF